MMEGISSSLYRGLKGRWKRKNYERLDGSHRSRRRKINRVELGSSSSSFTSEEPGGQNQQPRRKRFWRIKVKPKLRFFAGINSPKKFFQRLRDAYVNMMLGFANSRVCISSGYGGGNAFGMGNKAVKEYDEKVIVEIYKSLMAQGILPRDAARLAAVNATAAPIACRP